MCVTRRAEWARALGVEPDTDLGDGTDYRQKQKAYLQVSTHGMQLSDDSRANSQLSVQRQQEQARSGVGHITPQLRAALRPWCWYSNMSCAVSKHSICTARRTAGMRLLQAPLLDPPLARRARRRSWQSALKSASVGGMQDPPGA